MRKTAIIFTAAATLLHGATWLAAVPAAAQAIAAQWQAWRSSQRFTGNSAVPDFADPEQMNRYTWYQAHSWKLPYPGDTQIYAPSDVPGAYLPSSDLN